MSSPVLGLPKGQPGRFDGLSLGGVWVEPPAEGDEGGAWRMLYHGRGAGAPEDVVQLSMGCLGEARSDDGLAWSRVDGPLEGGAVLAPSSAADAFDAAHVGMGSLWGDRLYYFGGSGEAVQMGPRALRGVKQSAGLAFRTAAGSWAERRQVLAPGPPGSWDDLFVASPQVIEHGPGDWRMYYHGAGSGAGDRRFRIGLAVSEDGLSWQRRGLLLEPGEQGAWDAGGCSRRHVFPFGDDGAYAMLYEGTSADGRHGIGLALSVDGLTWRKNGTEPVLASSTEAGAWDAKVSAPHFVPRLGGGLLYYVGISEGGEPAVGVARAEGDKLQSFRRL